MLWEPLEDDKAYSIRVMLHVIPLNGQAPGSVSCMEGTALNMVPALPEL